MKKWYLHILLLAGLFGMLTTSCSQEEGLEPQASDEKVQVVFTIALDGQSARSRATWGDTYDSAIGNDFDNYIDPDKFFVKLTLGNTTYDVKNIAYWQQNSNKNIYEFVGEVEVPISATTTYTSAKVMVYANMTPAATTGGETFNANYSTYPGRGVKYIPMWGVQTMSNLSLTPGARNPLPDIYLLRAMAKVEVIMANEDYEISNIKLNGYNNTGYCLPTGWNAATTTTTTGLDLDGVFRPLSSYIGEATKSCFTESTTASGFQRFEIYVPEYRNIASNNQTTVTPSTITVTVDGKDYEIEFKKYADGSATSEAYNIVRNHIYRYNITQVKTGLNFTLSVVPWTVVTESFDYESELSYTQGTEWTNISKTTGNTIELKTSSDANASNVTGVYNFQINTPLTIEWMAVLEDPSMKFQFDMANTSGEGTAAGNAVQRTVKGELLVTGSNLSLGVKAVDPSESGQYEAKLRVYVTYNGKTIELDLVDGQESTLEHFTIQHSKL